MAEPRRASTDEETLLEDVRTRFAWVQEVEADWRRRAEDDINNQGL
jgi:hypothetical protein